MIGKYHVLLQKNDGVVTWMLQVNGSPIQLFSNWLVNRQRFIICLYIIIKKIESINVIWWFFLIILLYRFINIRRKSIKNIVIFFRNFSLTFLFLFSFYRFFLYLFFFTFTFIITRNLLNLYWKYTFYQDKFLFLYYL